MLQGLNIDYLVDLDTLVTKSLQLEMTKCPGYCPQLNGNLNDMSTADR